MLARLGQGQLLAVGVCVCVGLLGGCSSDDGESELSAGTVTGPVVLTVQQAEAALLAADDLGDDFETFWSSSSGPVSPDAADSDDDSTAEEANCLDKALGAALGQGYEASAEAESSNMTRAVIHSVASYATEEDLAEVFTSMRDGLEGCSTVEYAGEDEPISSSVTFDSDVSQDGVDEQLNIAVPGTIADDWREHVYSSWYSIVRMDNNAILVLVVTSEREEPDLSEYISAAVTKLQEVTSG